MDQIYFKCLHLMGVNLENVVASSNVNDTKTEAQRFRYQS
jgi:hypothetical protein